MDDRKLRITFMSRVKEVRILFNSIMYLHFSVNKYLYTDDFINLHLSPL